MTYDKLGGQYETAPAATAAANHDRMLLHEQEKRDAEAAAASARKLGEHATIVAAPLSDSSSSSSNGTGTGKQAPASAAVVDELQARLARMEQEMEALKAQLRRQAAQQSQQQ